MAKLGQRHPRAFLHAEEPHPFCATMIVFAECDGVGHTAGVELTKPFERGLDVSPGERLAAFDHAPDPFSHHRHRPPALSVGNALVFETTASAPFEIGKQNRALFRVSYGLAAIIYLVAGGDTYGVLR